MPPLIVNRFAPGPLMVTGLPVKVVLSRSIRRSPLVKTIVLGTLKNAGAKLIVSACAFEFACVTAARKLPAPLSLLLVTVKVAAAPSVAEQRISSRLPARA